MNILMQKGAFLGNEISKETDLERLKECHPDIYEQVKPILPKTRKSPSQNIHEEKIKIEDYSQLIENFKTDILKTIKKPKYMNNPLKAAQHILSETAPELKGRIQKGLLSLGCTTPETTNEIFKSWNEGIVNETKNCLDPKRSITTQEIGR
jgi:hypothetical protein